MARSCFTTEIAAPPDAVWRVLTDLEHRPEYEMAVIGVRDATGPLSQVGTTWIETRSAAFGKTVDSEFEVTRVDAPRLLEIQAAYRTAFGSQQRREIVLWQKVLQPEGLLHLITEEMPAEFKQPGRWMLDALQLRDQWQSRLLRTSSWSPLF